MKKGESPELSAKWWKASQPKGLKTAGKLEDALKDYEGAKGKLEKDRDEAAGQGAGKALDAIADAAKAVSTEAGKVKGNPEMEWTVDALKKLDRLIDTERRWAAEQADEEDGMFSDPDVYHTYLVKTLKRLRSAGEMNFGLVLGRKAENHRIALHKAKAGRALAMQVGKETGLHIMTFGVAMTPRAVGELEAKEGENQENDEDSLGDERASTLILNLEGKQLPGLKKKLTKMLKRFKPLPFKSVQLMVDGKEIEDVDDPEDTDTDNYDAPTTATVDFGALTRELATLLQQVKTVQDKAAVGDLARLGSQANAMIGAKNGPAATAAIAELRAALARAQGQSTAPTGDRAVGLAKSAEIWTATHQKMRSEYERLRAALVDAYKSEGLDKDIDTRFSSKIQPVLQTLNGDLSARLNEAAKATDNAKRGDAVKAARELVKTYKAYAGSEALLTDLDENPFVPLKVKDTVIRMLTALEQSVRRRIAAMATHPSWVAIRDGRYQQATRRRASWLRRARCGGSGERGTRPTGAGSACSVPAGARISGLLLRGALTARPTDLAIHSGGP
ncbi:MAG: hypothetical protein KGI51_00015 [Rhodospirillales bacterium]|nr:hypothetical protein [Rhodospirillales bacterium]